MDVNGSLIIKVAVIKSGMATTSMLLIGKMTVASCGGTQGALYEAHNFTSKSACRGAR